jgi:peptidoglycan/xylan/chitin deacetylase (PgdA/CDA1 family)
MKQAGGVFLFFFCLFCVLCFAASSAMSKSDAPVDRRVAITIDDLPAAANSMPAATITDMTTRLLATLQQQKIPVVGFVNEKKLYKWGEVDERIKALQMWLDAGFELGNHTFSHASLNKVGLKVWEDEVIQGESVISLLLAEHKMKLRYFRHPYLDTGRDLATRREAEAFLVGRGYRIAPVTLDGWDWMFAFVYEDAKKHGDTALQQEITHSYLSYHDAVFAYSEQLSKQIMGYEPKQILLLHANQLEADHIGDLADLMRKRGYRFITLEDALGDQAYSLPDTYVGEEGTGWLDHWAIAQGKPPQGEPVFPASVLERARALRQPQ